MLASEGQAIAEHDAAIPFSGGDIAPMQPSAENQAFVEGVARGFMAVVSHPAMTGLAALDWINNLTDNGTPYEKGKFLGQAVALAVPALNWATWASAGAETADVEIAESAAAASSWSATGKGPIVDPGQRMDMDRRSRADSEPRTAASAPGRSAPSTAACRRHPRRHRVRAARDCSSERPSPRPRRATGALAYEPVQRTMVTEHRALDEVTIVSYAHIQLIRARPIILFSSKTADGSKHRS